MRISKGKVRCGGQHLHSSECGSIHTATFAKMICGSPACPFWVKRMLHSAQRCHAAAGLVIKEVLSTNCTRTQVT